MSDDGALSPGAALVALQPAPALQSVPVHRDAPAVAAWFDAHIEVSQGPIADSLKAEREAAADFQRMAKSENTRKAYRAAVRAWCTWCEKRGVPALPGSSADVAAFLAAERHRGLSPNSIGLRRAAIKYLHRVADCPVPTEDARVAATVGGIRRDAARRGEQPRKKKAATGPVLRRLLDPIGDDLRGLRDRALILVGFAGALRRSELAAITVRDLEPTPRGLKLVLAHSKGSQAEAVTVPLPYGTTELCPVRALERWLAAAGITNGPVFRRIWLPRRTGEQDPPPLSQIGAVAITPHSVAQIVQARAVAAGFGRNDLGGHSLKRGALTTGMDRGVHPAKLRRLGRHKSFDVLGEYLEFGDLFESHPLDGVL